MTLGYRTIDADNHYYETRDAFTRHIEPRLAPRSLRVVRDREGNDVMLLDERPYTFSDPKFDRTNPPGSLTMFLHDRSHREYATTFTREAMLASDWYRARLEAQRDIDAYNWERHARYLEKFLQRPNYADVAEQLKVREKLDRVVAHGRAVREPGYAEKLAGRLGAEPAVVAELNRLALH